MENSEKKSRHQVDFFARIRKLLPASQSLAHVVSDLLGIGDDAAYRRIRGSKLLDFEETIKLCHHFNIAIDTLSGTADSQIQCVFSPLDYKNPKSFLLYAQNLNAFLERFRIGVGSEIVLTAADIPAFNYLFYKELTFFQLFSWNKSVCSFPSNYEEFIKELNSDELLKCFDKIVTNYRLIPSSEIWTTSTINSFLKLLHYHIEMRHFNDRKIPLLLCEQFLDLINTLKNWAETGIKGPEGTAFKLYISEIDIGNTFILLKNVETISCFIRLFAFNGLNFTDKYFCRVVEDWLRNSIKRSTLISGSSEKERYIFFDDQQQKIENLIKKIKK